MYTIKHQILIYACILKTKDAQGYPQRMRPHRRLYGIDTVCFLIFMIPCSYELLSFFAKILNKPFKDYTQGRRLHINLGWSYLKRIKCLYGLIIYGSP